MASLPDRPGAPERPSLACVCGRMAKADLQPHTGAPAMRTIAAEVIRVTADSQKAAASDIGIDRSRLSHKLADGSLNLAQLEALGPGFAVRFAKELIEQYAPLATPMARFRELLRAQQRTLDELAQLAEYLEKAS